MTAYYNEWEAYPAQWLRNLIKADLIAPGDVDERSIKDVKPDDLKGYTQCHFFAGIGGWSYALRLAGWEDERPVWTGSCPCQPFSQAGKQKGKEDERHLWPVWLGLIKQSKPPTIFGEQVSGAITHGWLDDVYQGLEGEGYAVGSAVLPAVSAGAPHKRDRLWFVADTGCLSSSGRRETGYVVSQTKESEIDSQERQWNGNASDDSGTTLADANFEGSQGRNSAELQERAGECTARTSSASMGNSSSPRWHERKQAASSLGRGHSPISTSSSGKSDFWEFEPAVGRVANGIPARSHKLRAYGNAIVPQVAQAFIEAYMEVRP